MRCHRILILFVVSVASFAFHAGSVELALANETNPTLVKAMSLVPSQQGIDYDRPEVAACDISEIKEPKTDRVVGYLVTSRDGMTLRKFVNTNGDGHIDRWSYYKDGLEVFRDIDTTGNGSADQCRWFNTAGSRWGIEMSPEGVVGRWKSISPEEVSAEAVAALAAKDWRRMERLLLTAQEAQSLGLEKEKQTELLKRLSSLKATFEASVRGEKALPSEAKWVQFSGGMPGVVPGEADALAKDLTVYENVAAVVQAGGNHGELFLGTLVRVGDAWRMIDVPRPMSDGQTSVATGFFFVPSSAARPKVGTSGVTEAMQAMLAQLEQIDNALQGVSNAGQAAVLHANRADLLEKIADAADSPQSRSMWYHQLADMANAAVQTGYYPDGAKRLGQIYDKLSKNAADKDLAAYIRFRQIMAEYGLSLMAPKANYPEIQKALVESLTKYVEEYPNATETPEAMLQLAITLEFTGEEEEAMKWHARIVRDAPQSPVAEKARGARTRLDSVGKQVTISGRSTSGKEVGLSDYRGKAVLVQYWATWCEPAKADIPVLKELVKKYGDQFRVIGVSLDNQVTDLAAYLKENPLPWPQIHEQGGLDSRPANQLGILTVPTMILIDKDGKVVSRNVSVAELDKELRTLLR
ncbi:MAG: redoxin domain-containing protein [Pirellulaceae bacterium]|nr:redoxin domain-containing protein [Pirellulaceae bacterium]